MVSLRRFITNKHRAFIYDSLEALNLQYDPLCPFGNNVCEQFALQLIFHIDKIFI